MSNARLELVWPNKDKFLLTPQDANGKPVWVEQSHPAAKEVRLSEFTTAVGEVDSEHPEADNLLFVGDSLDALRILNESPAFRREYRGKVKLIYIDPPYNTGSTFNHYDDWMEHSTWLSFMHARLTLMKDLLAQGGTLWVHLDDVEVHRMRLLLDEIFGVDSFVATVVWQKTTSARNDSKTFSTDQDYVLIYSKGKFVPNGLGRSEASEKAYRNPDDDARGVWREGDYKAGSGYSYGIAHPKTGEEVVPPAGQYWRFSPDTHKRHLDEGLLWWGKTNNYSMPKVKRFRTDVGDSVVPQTLWLADQVDTTRRAKTHIKDMFPGGSPFDTPKPERLMERIIHIATNPGDIVLDCFAGSGTTAAVAHKMGRRWVAAEILPQNVKAFTEPRLAKVVSGEDQGGISKDLAWLGGGGFRVIEIQDTFYAATPLGVMLTDDATGPRYARSVAGQLGFDWEPVQGEICGRRGRMRLAVIDGAVGIEELRQLTSELDENERITVVAHSILSGAEDWLSENSKGSLCLKAPADVLRERRKRRRTSGGLS
jgi:adenine-specific DNA-methyltransferase